MQDGTWVEYGTPDTPTLSHDEIEHAIARLDRFWADAFVWARLYATTHDGRDCSALTFPAFLQRPAWRYEQQQARSA